MNKPPVKKRRQDLFDRGAFLSVRGCGKIDINSVMPNGTMKSYVCKDMDEAIFNLMDIIAEKLSWVCPKNNQGE